MSLFCGVSSSGREGGLVEGCDGPHVLSSETVSPFTHWAAVHSSHLACRCGPGLQTSWREHQGCIQVPSRPCTQTVLGLWARASGSVTAWAPCCCVGLGQTLPSTQACPGSPDTPFPLDLTTWPLPSFTSRSDSLLSAIHSSFLPIPVSLRVTLLGLTSVLGMVLGDGKPAQPSTEVLASMKNMQPFITDSQTLQERTREGWGMWAEVSLVPESEGAAQKV